MPRSSDHAPVRVAKFGAIALLLMCASGADWRQFRGPDGRSEAVTEKLPTTWSKEKGIAWTADVPGGGVSGPIVVGDKVFVTASGGYHQDRLYVICYDTKSGDKLWQREFWATGRTLCHPTSSVAAPTPASDGKRIFAFYSSNDLACLDLDGNLLWYRGLGFDFPAAANDVGMASSPVAIGDTVVTQIECQGDSFACGLDSATGQTRWKIDLPKDALWCSPVSFTDPSGEELALIQTSGELIAVEPITGQEKWRLKISGSDIASPVIVGSNIFLSANGILALSTKDSGAKAANEKGTEPQTLWQTNKLSLGGASASVYGDKLLLINRAGVLQCAMQADGSEVWKLRIKGSHWATPIVAGEHLYSINQDGLAQVVSLDDKKPEIVTEYEFGEPVLGSPAAADGALYIRGAKHLWKIAE